MCQKIPYPTREAAKEDARFLVMQRRHYSKRLGRVAKSGRKLRPYQCRFCGCWHLTTRKK